VKALLALLALSCLATFDSPAHADKDVEPSPGAFELTSYQLPNGLDVIEPLWDALSIVIVGDWRVIGPGSSKLGLPVDRYDAAGRRL
jgi:hypothetical protein